MTTLQGKRVSSKYQSRSSLVKLLPKYKSRTPERLKKPNQRSKEPTRQKLKKPQKEILLTVYTEQQEQAFPTQYTFKPLSLT
ncbi:hypothetical protein L484_003207 [Morus notabilis]|uniref:Uncharacterized protein n=1 Tax=Morus notabilis TaxID=981085 RepID=W9R4Q9_9ROSA|nr:hypothetical protein L484_003207 [Morus notabilis]